MKTNNSLAMLYKPIQQDLNQVKKIIKKILEKNNNKTISSIGKYVNKNHGKLLRPTLTLLSAKATADNRICNINDLRNAAAAIELIHVFSLVHDDIIDNSPTRHNVLTIQKKFGVDKALIFGDWILSTTFALLNQCKNKYMKEKIIYALGEVNEGQLMELSLRNKIPVEKKLYLQIIKKKTATLLSVSCQAGALSTNSLFAKKLSLYGHHLGMAYQLLDDLEDIIGNPQTMGKPTGTDIASGEMTLPYIMLLKKLKRNEKLRVTHLIRARKKDVLKKLMPYINKSNILLEIKGIATAHFLRAKNSIEQLPSSIYKKGLIAIIDFQLKKIDKL